MIGSVYIKDGNIYFYNENRQFTDLGGVAYELGRPLLDFICYEHDRFDEAFTFYAQAFENEYAHMAAREPEFISSLKESMAETQQREVYIYFYMQMFFDFIYTFIESPRQAILQLDEKIPGAHDRLLWATDFEWTVPPPGMVYEDREKRLFRAAMDSVALMSNDFRNKQGFMINEIELLLNFKTVMGAPEKSSLEYLYMMEQFRLEKEGYLIYLENPFHTFYGALPSQEVVQLYEIDKIDDLCRFEFIKMIEHDIFIKKCKNCERFFIPRGRADAEYCNRTFGDTDRKCNEIGATLRYERKVAENPILEAHKKAYRRFNSRVRAKKMTQSEFMAWSDEASRKRDECLAGELSFDEFVAWLEQGRVRKRRSESGDNSAKI